MEIVPTEVRLRRAQAKMIINCFNFFKIQLSSFPNPFFDLFLYHPYQTQYNFHPGRRTAQFTPPLLQRTKRTSAPVRHAVAERARTWSNITLSVFHGDFSAFGSHGHCERPISSQNPRGTGY